MTIITLLLSIVGVLVRFDGGESLLFYYVRRVSYAASPTLLFSLSYGVVVGELLIVVSKSESEKVKEEVKA